MPYIFKWKMKCESGTILLRQKNMHGRIFMTEIQKSLESYITAEMDNWDFSGVVRIIQNGNILFETCRGFSNIEFCIKNTMETKFTVASVAKQFTAFAIMILHDKGLLQLDEKANRYLPPNMQLP